MDRTPRRAAMGFCDERFPVGTHMCLIYDDDHERRNLIAKYLDAGLHEGEKGFIRFIRTCKKNHSSFIPPTRSVIREAHKSPA
jgi:hypothetical protein